MARRGVVKVGNVDFSGLKKDLKRTQPELIKIDEVLDDLSQDITSRIEKGVSHKALAEVLRRHGVRVTPRALKRFLETGTTRPRRAAAGTAEDPGSAGAPAQAPPAPPPLDLADDPARRSGPAAQPRPAPPPGS